MGVERRALLRAERSGRLEAFRPGRVVVYRRRDVEALVESHKILLEAKASATSSVEGLHIDRFERALQNGARRSRAKAKAEPTLNETDAMTTWLDAWTRHRQRRGLSTAHEARRIYELHVLPVIASHVRDWTRDDFRRLSRELDERVQRHALSWKSAQVHQDGRDATIRDRGSLAAPSPGDARGGRR
jgi:hypothetical protein